MESYQLRTLQEQLNNIIENGNSTGDVFKDCIKHLLSTSAQELPAAEFRDKISSLLIHEIKKQDYDPTPLAHYAKEHHNFIQQFLNQHSIENLIWDLRNGPNALPVKSHTKRNFSGSSLVNWIMSHYNIKDRKEARCICDYLNQEENLFYHPKHLFRDDDTMFFFTQAKRVVIIGGGFAGSHIAKSLDKDGAYNIVLIAPKPFECVPSFPFIIGNADHVQKIRAEHRGFLSRTKIIHQKVTTVTPRQVILEDDSHIKYDTLVVATGSAYRMVFEGNNIFDSTCSDDMIAATEALKDANTACVVGAGSVGIEIASEIAARFPEVKLTIISASKEFLERSVPDAHKYVHQYFSSFPGVNLVMGERLQSFENNVVTTDAGTQVQADVLFPCLGFIPRTDILKQFLAESIDEKGFLNSEETLQIRGFPNIFGAGDIVPFDPEKLGQNAEAHADVVVKNIQLLDKKEKLKTYSPSNRVMLISLGPKRCLMINGNHVLMEGSATRKLKTLVEKKIMFSFH